MNRTLKKTQTAPETYLQYKGAKKWTAGSAKDAFVDLSISYFKVYCFITYRTQNSGLTVDHPPQTTQHDFSLLLHPNWHDSQGCTLKHNVLALTFTSTDACNTPRVLRPLWIFLNNFYKVFFKQAEKYYWRIWNCSPLASCCKNILWGNY